MFMDHAVTTPQQLENSSANDDASPARHRGRPRQHLSKFEATFARTGKDGYESARHAALANCRRVVQLLRQLNVPVNILRSVETAARRIGAISDEELSAAPVLLPAPAAVDAFVNDVRMRTLQHMRENAGRDRMRLGESLPAEARGYLREILHIPVPATLASSELFSNGLLHVWLLNPILAAQRLARQVSSAHRERFRVTLVRTDTPSPAHRPVDLPGDAAPDVEVRIADADWRRDLRYFDTSAVYPTVAQELLRAHFVRQSVAYELLAQQDQVEVPEDRVPVVVPLSLVSDATGTTTTKQYSFHPVMLGCPISEALLQAPGGALLLSAVLDIHHPIARHRHSAALHGEGEASTPEDEYRGVEPRATRRGRLNRATDSLLLQVYSMIIETFPFSCRKMSRRMHCSSLHIALATCSSPVHARWPIWAWSTFSSSHGAVVHRRPLAWHSHQRSQTGHPNCHTALPQWRPGRELGLDSATSGDAMSLVSLLRSASQWSEVVTLLEQTIAPAGRHWMWSANHRLPPPRTRKTAPPTTTAAALEFSNTVAESWSRGIAPSDLDFYSSPSWYFPAH